jgi:hypothetical protein
MQPFKPQTSGLSTHDPQLGHETRDVQTGGVYAFLIFLTISGAILFVLMGALYRFANRYAEEQDRKIEAQNPWVKQQADAERQEMKKMEQAFRAAGKEPSYKDVQQLQSQLTITRIREPRLQTEDVRDMEALRRAEDAKLNGYHWVDKNAGKVSIPIERAMELVVERQPAPALSAAQSSQPGGSSQSAPAAASAARSGANSKTTSGKAAEKTERKQ